MVCQQNPAARLDRQLIGRCARQGDAGSAERLIALDGRLLARGWPARALAGIAHGTSSVSTILPPSIAGLCARSCAALAALALRSAQKRAETIARVQRRALARQDRNAAAWFAFGGFKE